MPCSTRYQFAWRSSDESMFQGSRFMNNTEQQYSAELLRQRQREQRANAETEELSQAGAPGQKKQPHNEFPVSTIEIGLWLFPAIVLDTFEFFGQAVAAIPVVGWGLAGASSVLGAIMSGILFLAVGLWLFMKRVTPFSSIGLRIFLVLGGTAFGNAIVNWLPAWSGFFLWLFFMAHAREALFLGKHK